MGTLGRGAVAAARWESAVAAARWESAGSTAGSGLGGDWDWDWKAAVAGDWEMVG
jgi:hypothetical protein